MIQRIQTIYLVLGAVSLLGMLLFDDLWASPGVEALGWFEPVLLVLIVVLALGALVAIFLYKDRNRQRSVVRGLQLLTLVLLLVLVVGLYLAGDFTFVTMDGVAVERIVSVALPFLAYIFFVLARRGIEHDIALVRSMDRLR